MKIRTLLIGAAILTVVGIPLGLLTTGGLTGGGEAAAMSSSPPAQVDVAPVLIKRVQRWDEYNGRISAVGSVEIRSRVSGYVTHVAYREAPDTWPKLAARGVGAEEQNHQQRPLMECPLRTTFSRLFQ